MKFSESLKKTEDFHNVYNFGHSKADGFLVLYAKENGLEKNRLGISVSKKVGNSVVRHHLTRLIRESYRLSEERFHTGWDLVVVVRVRAKNASFKQINHSFLYLAGLHHLIQDMEVVKAEDL